MREPSSAPTLRRCRYRLAAIASGVIEVDVGSGASRARGDAYPKLAPPQAAMARPTMARLLDCRLTPGVCHRRARGMSPRQRRMGG